MLQIQLKTIEIKRSSKEELLLLIQYLQNEYDVLSPHDPPEVIHHPL